jgi:hypothetical protein
MTASGPVVQTTARTGFIDRQGPPATAAFWDPFYPLTVR